MESIEKKLNWYGRLNRRLKKTGDSEPEQAKLRLAIGPLIIIYISFPWGGDASFSNTFISLGDLSLTLATSVSISYSFCSLAIFFAILLNPVASNIRRISGIAVDLTTLSLLMLHSGDGSVPLFFIYLWVILGNGFRYGVKLLYVSQVFSIIGFLIVVSVGEYWELNKSFGTSLLLMLCLLPLYASFLLKKLHAAIDIAKQANKAKSRFLANMSHELRTPLNGVIGMGELLQETRLNYEQKELVGIMHSSANTLLELIENILDISKIEAGKMQIDETDIDLHTLVNSVIYMLAPMGEAKGLTVSCNFDPETPFALRGDQQHIRQILINLVNNAIKFTKDGSVTLSVKLAKGSSDKTPLIRFEVADTGIGISEESIDKIFENFTQADAGTSRSFGGTGLGTTISKELVELMDGEIGVESVENKGSFFWFELPLTKSRNVQYSISNNRILLLADEDCADIIRPFLKNWQVKFDWVQTPTRALSLLLQANDQKEAYDTLIVDQASLIDINAVLLAQMIKSEGLLEEMSLVLVNSSDTMIQANLSKQYYVSTIENPEEKRLLFNALHAAQSINVDGVKVVTMAEHYEQFAGAQSLNILVAEDNRVNQQVIERILGKAGHQVLMCKNGTRALDTLSKELENIDMVILDMNMPEVSGLDVVKALRFMDTRANIPVIMLTADATLEAKEAAIAAGANSFLTKPIDARGLLKTIASLSKTNQNRHKISPKGPRTSVSANGSFPESDWYNADVLHELEALGEGPDFVISLLKNFEREGSQHILNINNAKHNDFFEFREKLHALKGSATELGANRLIDICVIGESFKPYDIGTEKLNQSCVQLEKIFNQTITAFNNAVIVVQSDLLSVTMTDK
ncbi:MAG: two-component system sensor histidine kinase RpfC [Gammaproteobacteria bacterium]|jgi:two-component system sensor histidine kinase RpfC